MRPEAPLPDDLLRLARAQAGLLSSAQCALHEVQRWHLVSRLSSGTVRRIARDVYEVAPAVPVPSVSGRHERATWLGLLAYGPEAVAVGRSALVLLGVQGLPVDPVTEVALPRGRSVRVRGVAPLRQFDAGMTTVEVQGRRVAAPVWALAQTVPTVTRRHAVALLDSALHVGLLTGAPDVEVSHDLARRRRGVLRTHDWWRLADGRAESPPESWARLDCLDHGVPPDDLQVPVRDAHGILRGRGDLGWRRRDGRWLIAEIDGVSIHELPQALLHDRRRQNDLVAQGFDVLRFAPQDLRVRGGVGRVVARVLAGERRAA